MVHAGNLRPTNIAPWNRVFKLMRLYKYVRRNTSDVRKCNLRWCLSCTLLVLHLQFYLRSTKLQTATMRHPATAAEATRLTPALPILFQRKSLLHKLCTVILGA